jgi:hypothetical protein
MSSDWQEQERRRRQQQDDQRRRDRDQRWFIEQERNARTNAQNAWNEYQGRIARRNSPQTGCALLIGQILLLAVIGGYYFILA